MKSYLTPAGLGVLQASLAGNNTARFTGVQVGSAAGFVPTDVMGQAQGTVLVNNVADPSSVKITRIHTHEIKITAILDRTLEFDAVGNVLFFMNNIPSFWLVADAPFGKLKIDPISHFAGDKCYLPIVFRFPYIQRILAVDPENYLHARFPVFPTTRALTIPEHTPADQCAVEDNNLFYGQHTPFFGMRHDNAWFSNPLMRLVDSKFYRVDGGRSKTGM